MAYETRRARRIRLERERRQAAVRRLKSFCLTVVALILFAGVAIFIGTRDQQGEISLAGSKKAEDIKQPPKPVETTGQKLTKALPGKIEEIKQSMDLSEREDIAYYPSKSATAVSMIDLSDKGRGSANLNGDLQFTSASTYKIYVAYAMIHDVETGRRNWSSRINGTTWETCLSRMIINSDNACPEAYINSIGYTKFNQIVDGLGVSEQTQFRPYDMRTSANDLALVLQKLYKGELMTDENKNKLFSLMEQQRYRQGIPAGIGESGVVYDKVGFMDPLRHDAGIIHTDKGDYVLVVMTDYNSWSYIAKIAAYVNGEMSK